MITILSWSDILISISPPLCNSWIELTIRLMNTASSFTMSQSIWRSFLGSFTLMSEGMFIFFKELWMVSNNETFCKFNGDNLT